MHDLHVQYLYTLMNPLAFKGFFNWVYSKWVLVRVEYVAPPLQFLANVCVCMFLIQSLDRFVLCLGCFWIRVMKIKPISKQKVMDLECGDGDEFFPMVLVQIPMCNEKEVIFINLLGFNHFKKITQFVRLTYFPDMMNDRRFNSRRKIKDKDF